MEQQSTQYIRCPFCGSIHVVAKRQGFSMRNAILGTMFFHENGFWAGFVGSDDITAMCLDCGGTFTLKPQDVRNAPGDNSPYESSRIDWLPRTIILITLFVALCVIFFVSLT